jgi:aryl-alcohol dehydrogenase-like predicted oxidoreductase
MRYIPIHNTDLSPSALCLGTAGAGVDYDRPACFKLLDTFLGHGGNFLDTAKVYNNWIPGETSRSEKLLGAWMQERRNRARVILATKGGHPDPAHMDIPRLSPAEIVGDLEASLNHLQTDVIDLYWLHRDDVSRPAEDMLETLQAQVQAGKIRYYGCSNWRLERIQAAQRYAFEHGLPGFVAVQNLWSLAHVDIEAAARRDPTHAVMDDALYRYHRASQLAAIPFTSQANGLFQKLDAGRAIPASLSALFMNRVTEARYERLKTLRAQTGLTTTQIGLGYLTSQPFPTLPVIGPQSMAQLEDCLSAADVMLTSEQVAFLAEV